MSELTPKSSNFGPHSSEYFMNRQVLSQDTNELRRSPRQAEYFCEPVKGTPIVPAVCSGPYPTISVANIRARVLQGEYGSVLVLSRYIS